MKTITVHTKVHVPLKKAWEMYTLPKHIMKWNNASDDWHTPSARNDLRVGGKFVYRMEARDGSVGFDFNGVYIEVKENVLIAYTIEGGRKVIVNFSEDSGNTKIVVNFEPENENSLEMQRAGWQAILDNFKKYVEIH